MSKTKNEKKNYLDFIPVRSEKHKWKADSSGNVTIYVEHNGIFDKVAQKLFRRPKTTQVHLEETGSFVWMLIDGKSSIYELGKPVKEHFGEKAEPLYPRLAHYISTLEKCGFVYRKKR